MKVRMLWLAGIACLLFASIALAASTIRLRDGRVLNGEYKKIGGSYSIKLNDGSQVIVPAGDVLEIDGKPLVSEQKPGDASGDNKMSLAFKATKAKADKAESAILALQLWDNFIEKYPTSPDIEAARQEREHWDKLYKDDAEKINGRWISGKELKDLKKKCDELYDEAVDLTTEAGVRGVGGMKKLDEILKIYPNHFGANFEKGFYDLTIATRTEVGRNETLARGVKALERTSTLAPNVPEVWSNLAIGYNFQRRYQESIEAAWRAVTMRDDDKDLIAALGRALGNAPDKIVNVNPKIRDINEQAQVIFRKHGVPGGGGAWIYLRPKPGDSSDRPPEDVKRPPGVIGNGSGFLITGDGYLITNKHVVDSGEGHYYRIRFDDGSEKRADVIAVDDKHDLALLKIKTDTSLPYLRIAEDNPNPGAQAMVLGYPATPDGRFSLQVTSGDVKSLQPGDEYEVWYNLSTTQGNSGGPIVDKAGRVIGVLSAGANSSNDPRFRVTYVLGIGPNQIEDFLTRIGDKAPPITYEPAPTTGTFEAESLALKCRKSTLLVLIVRGDPGADKDDAPGTDAPSPDDATPPDPDGGGGDGGGRPRRSR